MKQFWAILLSAVLLVSLIPCAGAEDSQDFTIDEQMVFSDMSRSYLQGYQPSTSYNRLNLVIPIRSEHAVGSINAELIPAQESIAPFKLQNMGVRAQSVEDGLWAVRFSLELFSDRRNGDYPCTVRVSGADSSSRELSTDFEMVIHIRDGRPSTQLPQLSVEDGGTRLLAGGDGTLSLLFSNPSPSLGFQNLSVRITDPDGEILSQGSDTVALGDLMPGESKEIPFPVTVTPEAAIGPHSLNFAFIGHVLGHETRLELGCTFEVLQEVRLEQGGLRMPDHTAAGEDLALSLPLMNLGRSEIRNAMVAVSLPGIAEGQKVLVGVIPPGETRQAELLLPVSEEAGGDYQGSLTVSGEDSSGSTVAFDLPLNLTVEAADGPEAPEPPEDEGEHPPLALFLLSALCVLLLAALVVQGVLLRGRIRRLEERLQ